MGTRVKRLNLTGRQIKSILVDFVNVVAEMLDINDYAYKNVRLLSISICSVDSDSSLLSLKAEFINGPFCTYNIGVLQSIHDNDSLTGTPIYRNSAYGSDKIIAEFIVDRDSGVIKSVSWDNKKFEVSEDAEFDEYNDKVIRIDPLTNDQACLDYLNDNFTYCVPLNKPLIDYINHVLALTACTINSEKTGIFVRTVKFRIAEPIIMKSPVPLTEEYNDIVSGLEYADVNDLRTILNSEKPFICRASLVVTDIAAGVSKGCMEYILSNVM